MAASPENKVLLVEFDSPAALLNAARQVRDAGYKKFDCHSPFPIHGLNKAMGLRRSELSIIVGSAAVLGLSGAFLMAYWMSAVDYPLILSGKPFNSYQAYTPVVFAVAVLLAAISTFIGTLALNRLIHYHDPLFSISRFDKFSDDGFFISIDSGDLNFDSSRTAEFLGSIGGKNLEVVQS